MLTINAYERFSGLSIAKVGSEAIGIVIAANRSLSELLASANKEELALLLRETERFKNRINVGVYGMRMKALAAEAEATTPTTEPTVVSKGESKR